MSFLGYSTKTTSLKLLELVDITVSIICFIDEYTVLITGVLNKIISPSFSKFLPINPGVIAPIKVITKITITKPRPGIWNGNAFLKSKYSGKRLATLTSIKVITSQVT